MVISKFEKAANRLCAVLESTMDVIDANVLHALMKMVFNVKIIFNSPV